MGEVWVCRRLGVAHTNLVDNRGTPLSITFVYGNPEQFKRVGSVEQT